MSNSSDTDTDTIASFGNGNGPGPYLRNGNRAAERLFREEEEKGPTIVAEADAKGKTNKTK